MRHPRRHSSEKGDTKMTELLTAAQLAERLKVRPATVREWAKTGRIPEIRISAKVRRFDAVEVDAALRRQAVSNG